MDVNNRAYELSFEFYPPRTEAGRTSLESTVEALKSYAPDFFSLTFGAGGSSQDASLQTLSWLTEKSGVPVAAHISCIGTTRHAIADILQQYQSLGIKRLVVLRGDLPSGMLSPGEFQYASELVTFIREETGQAFKIDVAAYPEFHPQARDAYRDIQHFCNKVECGADSAITQFFFSADAYFRFVDSCRKQGVNVAIIPGIMPISNYVQLARFSDGCGAEIPRWLRKRMEAIQADDKAVLELGTEVVADLCRQLLQGGAPGLHFYCLNKFKQTKAILDEL